MNTHLQLHRGCPGSLHAVGSSRSSLLGGPMRALRPAARPVRRAGHRCSQAMALKAVSGHDKVGATRLNDKGIVVGQLACPHAFGQMDARAIEC